MVIKVLTKQNFKYIIMPNKIVFENCRGRCEMRPADNTKEEEKIWQ